jgi:hypothetical protein
MIRKKHESSLLEVFSDAGSTPAASTILSSVEDDRKTGDGPDPRHSFLTTSPLSASRDDVGSGNETELVNRHPGLCVCIERVGGYRTRTPQSIEKIDQGKTTVLIAEL